MRKMDVILRVSHVNTRSQRFILMSVIMPQLEYAGEGSEGSVKSVKKMQTVQIAHGKILECSKTTRNKALRVGLGLGLGLG